MKIILSQDVRGIGQKHDVKEVSDGYARNFLFPNHFAEPATKQAVKLLERKRAELSKDEAKAKMRLQKLARELNERHIEFTLKTGEDGSVYGSVTKEMILSAIRDHFATKDRVEIFLEHPIKKIGEQIVPVDLKKGIGAKLKIVVRAEE